MANWLTSITTPAQRACLLIAGVAFSLSACANTTTKAAPKADGLWQGKKAAVVLTYDDSIAEHLDNALPELDKRGLKATFYVTIDTPAFRERLPEWQALAKNGHELGNHTLFHPCDGSKPGRDWVAKDRDLSKWTVKHMVDNLRIAGATLEAIDGEKERTFAYTCGDTTAGGESFVEAIKPHFLGARAVDYGLFKPKDVDLFSIKTYALQGQSAAQLTEQVDSAIAQGGLLVFLFHGVGGGHFLDVSQEAHDTLLDYLVTKESDVWVTTARDAARFVKAAQK